MEFQADILGRTVNRPKITETTSLGAAYLAGLATGYWSGREQIKANWQLGKVFEPRMGKEKREELLKGWHRAVKCARVWAEG